MPHHAHHWLALALLSFSAASAAADGMPQAVAPPAYSPPPYVDLPYNWTGIYVGGQVGVATAGWDWAFNTPAEVFNQRRNAFIGGGQIGIQKQWGYSVIGAEVSFAWADLGDTSASALEVGTSRTSSLDTLLTVTGKVGAAYENMLAYFKGGVAFAEITFESTAAGGALATSSSSNEIGWVAGLGLEYGWTRNVILGVEYNYINFHTDTRSQSPTSLGLTGNTAGGDVNIQTLMARINYKFGP